jgi:type IV secretory pathway VirB2 component (pilin)
MKLTRILILAAPLVLCAATVFAAGASPMAGTFTTVEGWLTGDIAEWLGIAAIVGLGAMVWLAHEFSHMFMHLFRLVVAVGVVVFAIGIYTTAFGGGATIGRHHSTLSVVTRLVP